MGLYGWRRTLKQGLDIISKTGSTKQSVGQPAFPNDQTVTVSCQFDPFHRQTSFVEKQCAEASNGIYLH